MNLSKIIAGVEIVAQTFSPGFGGKTVDTQAKLAERLEGKPTINKTYQQNNTSSGNDYTGLTKKNEFNSNKSTLQYINDEQKKTKEAFQSPLPKHIQSIDNKHYEQLLSQRSKLEQGIKNLEKQNQAFDAFVKLLEDSETNNNGNINTKDRNKILELMSETYSNDRHTSPIDIMHVEDGEIGVRLNPIANKEDYKKFVNASYLSSFQILTPKNFNLFNGRTKQDPFSHLIDPKYNEWHTLEDEIVSFEKELSKFNNIFQKFFDLISISNQNFFQIYDDKIYPFQNNNINVITFKKWNIPELPIILPPKKVKTPKNFTSQVNKTEKKKTIIERKPQKINYSYNSKRRKKIIEKNSNGDVIKTTYKLKVSDNEYIDLGVGKTAKDQYDAFGSQIFFDDWKKHATERDLHPEEVFDYFQNIWRPQQ